MTGRFRSNTLKTVTLPVTVILILCSLVILSVYRLTEDTINDNAREYELSTVKDLMTLPYNNDLLNDYLQIKEPQPVSGNKTLTVYRARQDGKISGVVFKPVMARGYSGPIELAVGMAKDGTVLGVETLSQRETEGLGDQIDSKKSDWISIFTGIALNGLQPSEWATRSQGGKFDQISGATITSRGVINAVHETLEYHRKNHAKLYMELMVSHYE